MQIIKFISCSDVILVIYYTSGKCYQYALITTYKIQIPDSIFYTAEAAEGEGRSFLNQLS